MALRVLATARDSGSVYQNRAFIRICLDEDYQIVFRVIVKSPAVKIFSEQNIEGLSVCVNQPIKIVKSRKQLGHIFNEYPPDFVLLGLSGNGYGIDEIMREYSSDHNILCGVIQDYRGSLGDHSKSNLPDIIFCMSKDAMTITEAISDSKARCVVTGSPEYQLYNIKNWSSQRNMEHKNIILLLGNRIIYLA